MADKQLITQVLNNLLSHASKYSRQSSALTVSAVRSDFHIAVSISADSSGVAAPETSRLFRKFSRISSRLATDTIGGEDLALGICKGIVEAHGGRIWADTGEHGRGMTLTFEIPAAEEVTEDIVSRSTDNHELREATSGEKTRVLVTVDDARMLGIVRRTLSSADYTPVVAPASADVDRLMWEQKPQLLLMDLAALGNEGFNMIRSVSESYDVPVIVMSDQGDGDKIIQAYEMGDIAINYERRVVTVAGHQV